MKRCPGAEMPPRARTARLDATLAARAWPWLPLPGTTQATVTGEATSFTVPATSKAWLLPYGPQYEKERIETTAGTAAPGDYGYPSLFRVGERYVLVTEANADGRYDGSRLTHVTGSGTYALKLDDARVDSTGVTPWRTVIAGDLATVTESTLVDDLADASKLSDTSTPAFHLGQLGHSLGRRVQLRPVA